MTNPRTSRKYLANENGSAEVNVTKITGVVEEPAEKLRVGNGVSYGNVTCALSLRDMVTESDRSGPLGRLATYVTVRGQRRTWSRRVDSWERHASAGLEKVTAAVLGAAAVRPGDRVIDLGCGTGALSLPLAERGARVLAVDVSAAMVARLEEHAAALSLLGLEALAIPIESLSLPDRSVDLIVTSYTLHHLRDADKHRLVAAAYRWLRPGGSLIVADMMFGRGASRPDRVIIRSKVRALARKGIGGWWRIAKNSYRYLVRVQERPVSISAWTTMLGRAGFTAITASSIVAEAGLVSGQRPADPLRF